MIKKKSPRRKFMIYPNFQWALLTANFAIVLTAAAYIGWSARTAFARMQNVGVQMHLFTGHPFYKQIDTQAHYFYNHLFVGLLIGLAVTSVLILLMTNRVVGPVVRLKNYVNRIVMKEKVPHKPLAFRKGDFFPELPAQFNIAVNSLRTGQLQDDETTTTTTGIKMY